MNLSLDKILDDVKNFGALKLVQFWKFFENSIYSEFLGVFKNSLNIALLETWVRYFKTKAKDVL